MPGGLYPAFLILCRMIQLLKPMRETLPIPASASDRLLNLYLSLSQYPILASRIHELMRQVLFTEKTLEPYVFRQEVIQRAVQSQEREGLQHPTIEEPSEVWERRKALVADYLTDYYYSHYHSNENLDELIHNVLNERGVNLEDALFDLNPEIAPQDLLFEQGMMIERLPTLERAAYEARLREIKVVLIRTMISDQLRYINIAREWFTISDLADIRRHKVGAGRIGGKAAGMLLAARILKAKGSDVLKECLKTPVSFYLGSDLFYNFLSVNNLQHWNDQKYKDEDQMRQDYPYILNDFLKGEFTPYVLQHFETILSSVNEKPIIVRSSSLLEDNFGTAFAGKYESIFLANQGTPEENLYALMRAIAQIYASTLNPNALLYRRSRGLIDYDERMALLIQVVEGEKLGHYYLPQLAGVAFSHNQYRWSPQIRAEDGFIRLVWGLGTRAVDRVGNDYPRLIALSHPTLRPSSTTKSIRRYSQQYVDLINLNKNRFETQPVYKILNAQYKPLRFIAQFDMDGYFKSMRSNILEGEMKDLILTFDDLLAHTSFADQFRELLQILESEYRSPVDVEFTASIITSGAKPKINITLIQCRPQSFLKGESRLTIPADIPEEDKVFSSTVMVSGGHIDDINYILYVPADTYFSIPTQAERYKLERAIGKLNSAMVDENFICVGPGRWGTSNPDLGVHVDYADIFNCKALVELSGENIGPAPEPSLGTHFFQDLLEGQISPLSTHIGEDIFLVEIFESTPNHIFDWLAEDKGLESRLRLIRVDDYKPDHHLELLMEADSGCALAFLRPDSPGLNDVGM